MSVIWITGLSGAGKSTLAGKLTEMLRLEGACVLWLDGDELRDALGVNELGNESFERTARIDLAKKYSKLCKIAVDQGLTVVISTISLFEEIHCWNRENLRGYYEVYLKVPLQELKKRDPKNIYKKASKNTLNNVIGVDVEYDEPKHPDCTIDFRSDNHTDVMAKEIINQIKARNKI